jgi:hypothetical protein
MTDSPELHEPQQDTPEELSEVIAELEQYRDRLVSDTLLMAQRAKVMKSQAMASLEPNLAQIDSTLADLRQRHAALTGNH